MAEHQERIIEDPSIMVGKPVVRGTRIPVEGILNHLAGNLDLADLLAAYPRLNVDDVRASLGFAARVLHRSYQWSQEAKRLGIFHAFELTDEELDRDEELIDQKEDVIELFSPYQLLNNRLEEIKGRAINDQILLIKSTFPDIYKDAENYVVESKYYLPWESVLEPSNPKLEEIYHRYGVHFARRRPQDPSLPPETDIFYQASELVYERIMRNFEAARRLYTGKIPDKEIIKLVEKEL